MRMNAAEELEFKALARQKPMNDVIDRGDSPVQQFYCGATVFITGGAGFIGKQLIEKLLRACQIKKLYVLLRPKKGKTVSDRLEIMLKDPVYDLLRKKQPKFEDIIVPISGDVAEIRLGISQEEWIKLTKEVDTIFHVAATVRFDEPLRTATMTNVRGTREILALARDCMKLKKIVHVSTAFSHANDEHVGSELLEKFYPCPMSANLMIQLAEELDEAKLNNITPELLAGWPNTYTFTKAIAEEMVRASGADLPLCVVRPPIVVPSYYEPSPGWVDMSCIFATSGTMLGVALGLIHILHVKKYNRLHTVPVDVVNNATIAAGWDSTQRREDGDKDVPVYNIVNYDSYITYDLVDDVMTNESKNYSSPKAIWYCFGILTSNTLYYWILALIFHYIPALMADAVFSVIPVKPKGIPSLFKIFRTMDKLSSMHNYFVDRDWIFKDHNVQDMINRMSDADKAIFNCDLTSINPRELIKVWTLGLRKYIVKDGLEHCEEGVKKQKKLRVVHYVFMALYLYVLWSILSIFWNILKFFFNIIVM